jgi:hypothetical protein
MSAPAPSTEAPERPPARRRPRWRLQPQTRQRLDTFGPPILALLLTFTVLLAGIRTPIVEDSLFWWIPQALIMAERGLAMSTGGPLPELMAASIPPEAMPSQWADGVPDYAHPPLWTWWLALWLRWFGASTVVIHLACAAPAAAIALGLVAVARRLGDPWLGPAALALPPLSAQLLRPELDLPLLAVTLWALVALLDGKWRLFVPLALLAPWVKEPGVLLVVPALIRARYDGWRRAPLALIPLISLGLWGIVHGGLAKAEKLPAGLVAWLTDDLPSALWLNGVHHGRFLLLLGLPLLWQRRHRVGVQVVGGFALCWIVFFSIVGFKLQPNNPEPITHVRYFVPGMVAALLLLGQRSRLLPLAGLAFMQARSPYGPEANHFGLDAARAEAAAVPWIRAEIASGRRIWVGQYQGASLSQPWAGQIDTPIQGIAFYGQNTDPMQLSNGDGIVEAAYGEPMGLIDRVWNLTIDRRWTLGHAVVSASVIGERTGYVPEMPGAPLGGVPGPAAPPEGGGAPEGGVPPPPEEPPPAPPPEADAQPPEGVAPPPELSAPPP